MAGHMQASIHDPIDFVANGDCDEALARLEYLAESQRRLGLLLGTAGSGKSLLLELFAERLRRLGHPHARLSLVGLSPHELVWALCTALRADTRDGDGLFKLWRVLGHRLAMLRAQGRHTVLLLDDADDAGAELQPHVERLIASEGSLGHVSIVLAAAADQLNRLPRRVRDMADLRIDLHGWQAAEIRQCLEQLRQKHAAPAAFSPEAVARLEQLSAGIPRRVRQLADLAMLAAAGQQLQKVDAQTVQSVYDELAVASL